MTRAAIYLRESGLQAAKEGRYGLPVQEEHARTWCATHGYTVIEPPYVDPAGDSYDIYRPAMDQLRAHMQAGKIDVIVVDCLDRLGRDPGLIDYLIGEAEFEYHVRYEFTDPDEQFDDSFIGKLKRYMKASAAQEYRETVIKKTQAGRRKRASEGKVVPGRTPPYGYTFIENKTQLAVAEGPAGVMRRAYDDTIAGASSDEICDAFWGDRIPLPSGALQRWRPENLNRMLRSSTYKGEYVIYKYKYTKKHRLRRDGKVYTKKVVSIRPADDPLRIVIPVPAIVSPEEWEAVQRIIDARGHSSPRRNADPEATLLRGGLAVCGYCGKVMHAHRKMRTDHDVWRYGCAGSRKYPGSCPAPSNEMAAALLDPEVWECLKTYLFNERNLHAVYKEYIQCDATVDEDKERDLALMEKILAKVDQEIANLTQSISQTTNETARAALIRYLDETGAARESLLARQRDAQVCSQERQRREASRKEFLEWAAWVHEKLQTEGESYALRRGLLSAFEIRIVIWRADHTPRWVAIVGMDGLIDQMLAPGQAEVPNLTVLSNDGVTGITESNAHFRDIEPAIERELVWRLRRKPGYLSQLEREQGVVRYLEDYDKGGVHWKSSSW